ncbi:MAG: hypothetical protein K2W95_29720 [Candidatus Obscuribacterales bacterium]|nr:hypothetical protein [Candidatus Obscuribacterales bacterium]
MVILKNRGNGGTLEFRVSLVAAAENLYPQENESIEQLMARRWFVLTWFSGAAVYGEARKARAVARRRVQRLRKRRRVVEYGICTLDISNEPFPLMDLLAIEAWLRRRKAFPFETG